MSGDERTSVVGEEKMLMMSVAVEWATVERI